jgi:hypothetical protein
MCKDLPGGMLSTSAHAMVGGRREEVAEIADRIDR